MKDLVTNQTSTSLHASITAMPAGNVFAAAPGTDASLKIEAVYACASTATTNQEIAFGPTTSSLGLRSIFATKGQVFQHEFEDGWVLETNTSFGVWLATTGAVYVTCKYSVIKRGNT